MISKRLETLLIELTKRSSADLVQRFQTLREYRVLPTSRGRYADNLTTPQVVAGLLSVVPERPGYAGQTVQILRGLRPVGGERASFRGAASFGKAVEELLSSREALDSVLEVRATDSEVGMNSSGRAAILYRGADGHERTAWFVRKEAVSLLQPGAEVNFNPRDALHQSLVEWVFYRKVFRRIHDTLLRDREHQHAMGVSRENDMLCADCGESASVQSRPRTDDVLVTCDQGHVVSITRTAWPRFSKLGRDQQNRAYLRAKEAAESDEIPVVHSEYLT